MGQELMNPHQIADICEGRDKAISLWLGLFDQYHATTAEAGSICIGGNLGLSGARDHHRGGDTLTAAFVRARALDERDPKTGKITTIEARDNFERIATMEIDRRCWSNLMERLGFDQLLDETARREFYEGLREAPAPFTTDNCAATFGHIWENRRDLYLRGIATVFSKLDRRFRSHDGFKIGARLIIDGAMNEWGSWERYERRDSLRDVERVFLELDDKAPLPEGLSMAAIVGEAARDRVNLPTVVHGDYFRVRIFKNGNLHIWFERADLLQQVNLLLAEYYGEAIGDSYDTTEAEDAPLFHVTPAKDFGAFMTSPTVAAQVVELARIMQGDRVLEPSAGKAAIAGRARDEGGTVTCIEIQPGLAHELRVIHGFADVRQADFLTLEPRHFAPFDKVVMNPPFDRGRDCDHVRHAYQFLKPGGVLVAVMSARAEWSEDKRHKALHRIIDKCTAIYGNRKWIDLPAGSFAHAGTNVNTVLLAIRKPD